MPGNTEDEIDMKIRIGKTLSKLLQGGGLTLKVLSQRSGVPASTLSEWKANRKPKDPIQVQKVASCLGVTMHFLLFGEEDEQETLQKVIKEKFFQGTFEVTLKKIKITEGEEE